MWRRTTLLSQKSSSVQLYVVVHGWFVVFDASPIPIRHAGQGTCGYVCHFCGQLPDRPPHYFTSNVAWIHEHHACSGIYEWG